MAVSRIRQLFVGLSVWRCAFYIRILNVGLVVGKWQLGEVTSTKTSVSFAIYNFTHSSGSYITTL